MSARDARRARWRADLRDFTSTAMRSAGLEAMADQHEATIRDERVYADLMDELAAAKAGDDREVLQDVKRRVTDFRKAQRTDAAIRPGVVNDFAEPTDDELIEMGYK